MGETRVRSAFGGPLSSLKETELMWTYVRETSAGSDLREGETRKQKGQNGHDSRGRRQSRGERRELHVPAIAKNPWATKEIGSASMLQTVTLSRDPHVP